MGFGQGRRGRGRWRTHFGIINWGRAGLLGRAFLSAVAFSDLLDYRLFREGGSHELFGIVGVGGGCFESTMQAAMTRLDIEQRGSRDQIGGSNEGGQSDPGDGTRVE